jgi:hypothetical protein
MRSTWPVVLAGVMLGAVFMPAQATCFLVFDRNDNLIYRSQQAPVDMSDPNDRAAAAAREAMRARGEYMMYIEADQCAPLTMMLGPGASGELTIDAIVAGIPSMSSTQGVPFGSAAPGSGITPSTRVVGVSRGGVGVMRATPGPAYK